MLTQLRMDLKKVATAERAKSNAWFFKTGPGQYGEGDKFIGVSVPELRAAAKKYKTLSLNDVEKLLKSEIHEERLLALFILVGQFKKADEKTQTAIYHFYLANTKFINNWDMVDCSAEFIVGPYLETQPKDILFKLVKSELIWDRRIAMLATFHYIKKGDPIISLEIAQLLLTDKHDLIQKAVGWMLREVGKRCGEKYLTDFLDEYAATMPRTTLRYAIEHFPPEKRQAYLALKRAL